MIWSASAAAAGITSFAYFLALLTVVSADCLAVSTAVKARCTSFVGGSASWMRMLASCRPISSVSRRCTTLSLMAAWISLLPVVMTVSTL